MSLLEPDDDLIEAGDLEGFPGAPFDAAVVQAAAQAVRAAVDWHVAPLRTETRPVDSPGGTSLLLPTLNLVSIESVRDVTDDPAGPLIAEYRTHDTDRFRAGIVDRPGGWPRCGVVAVEFTHGYEGCPAELAAAIAELCVAVNRGGLSQRSLGDKSESWRDVLSPTSQQALSQYRIPRSP